MAKKGHFFSWTGYAAQKLVSATVEDAAKQDIVLTFTDIRPFRDAVFGDFTTTGTVKTVDSVTLDYAAKTVTVHVTVAFANGNPINCVYDPPIKGAAITIPVTNNVV